MSSSSRVLELTFLLLTITIWVSNAGIVHSRGPLNVSFGKRTSLPKSVLRIRPSIQDSACVIKVLYNEASLDSSVGRLHPSAFPCNFTEGSVYYEHLGLPMLEESSVDLLITYTTDASERISTPFSLAVNVSDSHSRTVFRNSGLTVENFNGYSQPITSSVFGVQFDGATQTCQISLRSGTSPHSWPRYGNVVNDSSDVVDASCTTFISSGITYKHTALRSPKTDYLQGLVILKDISNGQEVDREWFSIRVTIEAALTNQPPTFRDTSLLQLNVHQFITTAITPDVLSAEDDFTNSEDIIFFIKEERLSGDFLGRLISTDRSNYPVSSFTQVDVQLLMIAYQPPSEDSDSPRLVRIPLSIKDGEGLESNQTFELMVTIQPMDTTAPIVTKNTGLLVREGERGVISSQANLHLADEDNLADIKISVQHGLRHGHLILPDSRDYFTIEDLNSSSVVYVHDGSNSFTDNIIFKAYDDKNEIEFLFPITILPVDDSSPVLSVNTGLRIFEGMTYQLTSIHISASDEDSENAFITYILEQPYSTIGELILQQNLPEDQRGWVQVGDLWEKRVTSWTESDIQNGYLHYRHTGRGQGLPTTDAVRFKLRDTNTPPNISPTHVFEVKVLPRDLTPPSPSRDASFHLTVPEGRTTPITSDELLFVDEGSNDRNIVYTISSVTSSSDDLEAGKIVYADTPDVEATMFTQAEVSKNKISYKPAGGEIGMVPRMIRVVFDVQDSSGNVVTDHELSVFVQPINNQPPRVTVRPVQVFENGYVIIMPNDLDAVDVDTSDESLTFTVQRPPRSGQLKLQGVEALQGSKFTKNDISNGGVVYSSESADSQTDTIVIDVSDGVHHIPAHMRVSILDVDGGFPTYDSGDSLVYKLRVNEGATVYLSTDMLPKTGVSNNITFTLQEQPIRGVVAPEQFTLTDLQGELVTYKASQEEIGAEALYDAFNLTISSGQLLINNKLTPHIVMQVTILPVDNNPPVVSLGSTFYVNEGGVSVIMPTHINIIDVDSASDDVLCSITMQPQYGFLELSSPAVGSEYSRSGQPINVFSLLDLNKGHLNYKQSIHEGVEPTSDTFRISCSDGINIDSHGLTFYVDISGENDETPRIFVNDFVVEEGRLLTIDLPILNVIDRDEPPDLLRFKVLKKPINGKILESTSSGALEVTEFMFDDIRYLSKIAYQHSGTETTNDSFTIQVTDGSHSSEHMIPIRVLPVDDEQPQVIVNTGLYIEAATEQERPEWKYITSKELQAEDLDSPDGNITFKIRQQPVFGFLQRRLDTGGNNWDNVTRHMTFQQWEVDDSYIRYVHNGRYGVRDVIKLDVIDNHKNSQIDKRFYVTVEPLDMVYPDIVNRGVELPEAASVVLTTDMLSAWDDKSSADSIVFTLTSRPKHGHLELVSQPGRRINTFSQVDLAAGRVRYTHDGSDRKLSDAFEFEVTDGFNPLHRAFSISVVPIDNKMPVLMIQPIRLREKGSTYITPNQLTARDRDTRSDLITFTITQAPLFGSIKLSGAEVSHFTQNDLENGRVTYEHTGPEVSDGRVVEDSFKVKVSDGTHNRFFVHPNLDSPTRRSQTVRIQIVAVDDSVPQLVINRPATSLRRSGNSDKLKFTLTSSNLKVTDRDTPNDYIMYWVIDRPAIGRLVKGGQPTNMWTQADLDNSMVTYVLNEGVDDTSDHFTFRVQDAGGNDIPSTVFTLTWSYTSFKFATVEVNETDALANVTMQRRGSLANTAFVTVNVRDVTTTEGEDYSKDYAKQVQFNPGEIEKVWQLPLVNDKIYEVKEMVSLQLSEPVGTILEPHEWTTLTIKDEDDQPVVSLATATGLEMEENIGRGAIKMKRTGDDSTEVVAVCNFKEGTTRGTDHPALYTDFILRTSAVRFAPGESESFCYVDIVDDTYVEPDEYFNVFIEKVEGGLVGNLNTAMVTILADDADLPKISFETSRYEVTEGEGSISVTVERKGGDITQQSEVLIVSKRYGVDKAQPMTDYIPISHTLTFSPGEVEKQVSVTILDDRSMPMVEGSETFRLLLRIPDNAILSHPNSTIITIKDELDVPTFAFTQSRYVVSETNNTLSVVVVRYGDLSTTQTIQCITTSGSAREGLDFIARRSGSDVSAVTFRPGEREKTFNLTLINDRIYEGEETLQLTILTTASQADVQTATVTITDNEDKPVLGFIDTHVYASEPASADKESYARVTVQRQGDVSRVSIVTVYTKEGTANSITDYIEKTQELEFGVGVRERSIEVKILYDGEPELKESFFVLLSSDSNGVASVPINRCSVYITDENSVTGLVFPVDPVVVSLKDYDNAKDAGQPINGYPLICITPCDERHPEYGRTKIICDSEGIDNSLTAYRWKVGEPVGRDGVAIDLQTATSQTFMSATTSRTLESIYFGLGSRVQCIATASSTSDYDGLERESAIVTISTTEGICKPQRVGFSGGEPYLTKIKYLGSDHKKYPNHLKLSISIPHRDGMLPTISTEQLANFEYMLSPSASRVGLHRCSNLVRGVENKLNVGWRENKKADIAFLAYQHDRDIRGDKSVRFNSNLDLENCVWEFDGLFKTQELVQICGAEVETNGQVQDLTKSYLSLVIPLFVSYVFHSPTAPGGWLHYDLSSNQRVTFVYDTAMLHKRGISNMQADDSKPRDVVGRLYLQSVKLQPRGHLVVEFQTQTKFYGKFVMTKGRAQSSVTSHDHLQLTFDLQLTESEDTFDNPKQVWQFVSDSAVQDYTGSYLVKLIPCMVRRNVQFSPTAKCTAQNPVTFQLDIELQQVSDPVSEVFSLNTELTLTRNKRAWLTNNRTGEDLSDVAFHSGEKIYGRVDTRHMKEPDSLHDVLVEKVFVCSGRDGFVPKYRPDSQEYGCAARSGQLQAQYKILDKSSPDLVTTQLNGVPFNAKFAADDNKGRQIYNMPGTDGFMFDSKPLNSELGRKWFVHVIYSVDTLTDPLKLMRRYRRAQVNDLSGVGKGKGTNMAFLYLAEPEIPPSTEVGASKEKANYSWIIAVAVVTVLLAVVLIGISFVAIKISRMKRSKSRSEADTPSRPEETQAMASSEDGGVIRIDATVSNTDV